MEDLFKSNPLQYAYDLIDEGRTNESNLLAACLKWMSHDQIRDMLKENELDPDFLEGYYGEEEISKEERFACEMYNDRYSYYD
jgi:hypothetical protein